MLRAPPPPSGRPALASRRCALIRRSDADADVILRIGAPCSRTAVMGWVPEDEEDAAAGRVRDRHRAPRPTFRRTAGRSRRAQACRPASSAVPGSRRRAVGSRVGQVPSRCGSRGLSPLCCWLVGVAGPPTGRAAPIGSGPARRGRGRRPIHPVGGEAMETSAAVVVSVVGLVAQRGWSPRPAPASPTPFRPPEVAAGGRSGIGQSHVSSRTGRRSPWAFRAWVRGRAAAWARPRGQASEPHRPQHGHRG